METQKIIEAIDAIKDAHGEEALALRLIRWHQTRAISSPMEGNEGGLWISLLKFAQKQALVGVMFEGIMRLPKELAPKGQVLLTWIAQAQMIERQNRRLNAATVSVFRRIREMGAECCILKGQGNALLYQNPLSRTPGDVDVWSSCPQSIVGRASLRTLAAALTKGHGTIEHDYYEHIVMTVDGIPVELHPTPAIMNYPPHNRRLQQWLKQEARRQCCNMVELPDGCGSIAIPTTEFNLVYQLLHLHHHHLFEGIGLRQFVDYALLLKRREEDLKQREDGGEWRENTLSLIISNLKSLHLVGFAGAVMYVLQEVFGLKDDELLVPIDKKRGKLLLADILHGGNFGQHDTTFARNALGHNLQRIYRDIRLMRYYPFETLSEPFFRLWHFFWRKRQKG